MLAKQTIRRFLVAMLVLLGAAMIFIATETLAGAMLITLGVSVEAIGIAMRHK